jgi:hypothetical protein
LSCPRTPVFANLLRSPGIDFHPGGIESSESISGLLLNVYKYGLWDSFTETGVYEAKLKADGTSQ